MQITTASQPLHDVSGDWLVVGVWEDDLAGLEDLDVRLGSALTSLRSRGDLTGKLKDLVPLWHVRGIGVDRLLLVGLGARAKCDRESLAAAGAVAARHVTGKLHPHVTLALPTGTGIDD